MPIAAICADKPTELDRRENASRDRQRVSNRASFFAPQSRSPGGELFLVDLSSGESFAQNPLGVMMCLKR
jgi:hypothetical protein